MSPIKIRSALLVMLIEKIAIIKMDDLNANSVDQAKAGTAKSGY